MFIPVVVSLALQSSIHESRFEHGITPTWIQKGSTASKVTIEESMRWHGVPGMSIAVVDGGKVVWAKGYGSARLDDKTPVTAQTLFQAGSVSKSVSAAAALKLVEEGKLKLDANINDFLTSWKLPENDLTRKTPVTLRRILSHTAGFTVHGFGGYEAGTPVPTLPQIFAGQAPANSPEIKVVTEPGTAWAYSGGGYTVMQQAMIDAAQKPFPEILQTLVLGPLGMKDSSFEQPLAEARAEQAATGYYALDNPVKGRYHTYPEMAAAGLWTTPTDLAKFVIGIQGAYNGKPDSVLKQETVKDMLTVVKNGDGLGLFLVGKGQGLQFSHNGRDEGFDTLMIGYAEQGKGVVIMINSNNDIGFVSEIYSAISNEYGFPGAPKIKPNEYVVLSTKEEKAICGDYTLEGGRVLKISYSNPMVTLDFGGGVARLMPVSAGRLVSGGASVNFKFGADGVATQATLNFGQGPFEATRKP